MHSFHRVVRLSFLQGRALTGKPIFWMAILLSASFTLAPSLNMQRISMDCGYSMQLLEPYILCGSDYQVSMQFFLGLLLLLSDAPFIDDNIVFIGLRVSRKEWLAAQLLYIAGCCLLYHLSILLWTVIWSSQMMYIGNVWSRILIDISTSNKYYSEYHLSFANAQFLRIYSPFTGCLLTLLLQTSYGFILCSLMFLLNLRFRRSLGTMLALLTHGVSFLLIRGGAGPFINLHFIPFVHALAALHDLSGTQVNVPSMQDSFLLWALLILAICAFSRLSARSLDYLAPGKNI